MAVGTFPFNYASEEDENYKLIIDHNINEFWRKVLYGVHISAARGINPELKKLIFVML